MKTIISFLWFCAGVNPLLMKRCPTETDKYIGIGATVLFTALMAFISGSYAFYTVFENVVSSILFGSIWALLIFNLDRYIVMSIRKIGDPKKEWMMAMPRIILAIVIAIVISKPLELRILRSKINEMIFTINEGKTVQLSKDHQTYIHENFEVPVSRLQEEIVSKENSLPLPLKRLEDEKKVLENKKQIKQKEIYSRNRPLYEHLNELETSNNDQKNDATIAEIKRIIRQNNSELIPILNEISSLENEIKQEFQSYRNELETLRIRNNQKIADLEHRRSYKITEFLKTESDGKTIFDNCRYLPDQIAALSRLKKSDPAINSLSLFIFLLFLSIETAPVIVKLLSQKGPYDDLLRQHEHVFEIGRIEKISRLNQRTNDRLRLVIESGTQAVNTELSGKKELQLRILSAEMDLAQEVINEWKAREKKNIKANIDLYLNINKN